MHAMEHPPVPDKGPPAPHTGSVAWNRARQNPETRLQSGSIEDEPGSPADGQNRKKEPILQVIPNLQFHERGLKSTSGTLN